MIFAPDMLELVLAGKKTVTRRPARVQGTGRTLIAKPCRYVGGGTYAIQPGRGRRAVGRLRVLNVSCEVVLAINEADARAEGFPSVAAFYERWRALHRDLSGRCWRIEFELVTCDDDINVAAADADRWAA